MCKDYEVGNSWYGYSPVSATGSQMFRNRKSDADTGDADNRSHYPYLGLEEDEGLAKNSHYSDKTS